MKIKCPACGVVFEVEDPHRPFRCSRCGSLLDLAPPDWSPRVLIPAEDIMGSGG